MGHKIADDGSLVEAVEAGGEWILQDEKTGILAGYGRPWPVTPDFRQCQVDVVQRGQSLIFQDANGNMSGEYHYTIFEPNKPISSNGNRFVRGSYTEIINAGGNDDVISAAIRITRLGPASKWQWVAHLTASSAHGRTVIGTWWFKEQHGNMSLGSYTSERGEASIYVRGFS